MSQDESARTVVILTVIMVDTHRTRCAIVHENEHLPYRRRTVQITLTPEQAAQLRPRLVGEEAGRSVYEEIGESWLEHAGAQQPSAAEDEPS